MKTLIALAIAAAVLASAGCCIPLHPGRHHHYYDRSDGPRRADPPRPPPAYRERDRDRR